MPAVAEKLPSPSEIPALLEATGANFNKALVNSPEKAGSYSITGTKAALNMGIYATDAGYLTIYDKVDAAANSLKAVSKLGAGLGVGDYFEALLKNRLEKNLNNKDSLTKVSEDGMNQAYKFLKENDRGGTGAIVGAGIFTEGLYISTSLVQNYPHDLPDEARNVILVNLVRTILDQKRPLQEIITLLERASADKEAAAVLAQMKELKSKFDALNVDDKIKENKGALVLNDATLKEITKLTAEIRAGYVK